MNCRQAYRLGVESGLEAGEYGDFSKRELAEEETFTEACFDICENKRQFAGHPGYQFNQKPNADHLWDAFERGESVGIRRAWRERHRHPKKSQG